MARISSRRKENQVIEQYLKTEAAEMARILNNKSVDSIEPEGSLEDVAMWNVDKAKELAKLPRELLTPELRRFLAYMALKSNK